ncbi:hypothetical protein K431DRAFT_302085 [Polychaeton citri CBS 116435]|uniref:Uncharacterized protein n=1 Tax=Polychaeton citri CBS 116435 TaxID=1314669 RepID=A0A9P4QDZ9_9PEZI|nr:hypothetical protein K431DRAFT_302085 [Polychaeton citri CBS 116435]
MASLMLIQLAQKSEDAASGLVIFKDNLSHESAPRVTAVIGDLFAISAVLREIDNARRDARLASRLHRIRDDLRLAHATINHTIEDILAAFPQASRDTYQQVWDELTLRMLQEELVQLPDRLAWYRKFLRECYVSLTDRAPETLVSARKRLAALLEQQTAAQTRRRPLLLGNAGSTMPRPRAQRHPSSFRLDPPLSPTSSSDHWENQRPPPLAPEPPPPVSPTFTTDSSPSLMSSQTSYTTDLLTTPVVHWAEEVFDGSYPQTAFRDSHQRDEPSKCYGNINPPALSMLSVDGFVRILELPFDRETVWVRLYWRPQDGRSRILFMARDDLHRDVLYCVPLTNLKVIRDKSCLQLCRASRDDRYILWAKLNFALYEKMALFYSTFVAVKHQDKVEIENHRLLDHFELREEIEYAGQICDGQLLHALRLFRDRGSGVIRLEASALRGPMRDVPLWTAFVTKYVGDPDHFQDEGGGRVHAAALRPPPYYFNPEYAMAKDRFGAYILNFTSATDARGFMNVWRSVCNRANRS